MLLNICSSQSFVELNVRAPRKWQPNVGLYLIPTSPIPTNVRRCHISVLHNCRGFPSQLRLVVMIKRKTFLRVTKNTHNPTIFYDITCINIWLYNFRNQSQKCANCLLNTWLPRQLFPIVLTNFDLCGFFSPNTAG